MAKVILSVQAREAIRADILQRPRIEACGLLIGEITPAGDWIADEAFPLRNIRNSSVRFEFDSLELLEYHLTYGERIVGAYHSHPGGPPYPSGIDTGNMQSLQESPWVWLIASFAGRRGLATDAEADGLSIAAFRYDPQSGLQTIPIFISAALQREQKKDDGTPGDQ
jgi:proteasome lid subunit RPN8/RPN11